MPSPGAPAQPLDGRRPPPRRPHWPLHVAAALALLPLLAAAQGEVVMDLRPQPGRALRNEMRTENLMSMRLVEDRGLGAKLAAAGRPTSGESHTVMDQQVRLRTGPRAADGSFDTEMTLLARRGTLKLPGGEERALPAPPGLEDVRSSARLDAGGALLPGSLQVQGGSDATRPVLQQVLGSVLAQTAGLPPLRLAPGVAVPREQQLKLPLPGLGEMTVRMTITHRLLALSADGIAHIELLYTMDFDSPGGGPQMRADGSGGGLMLYDTRQQLVRSAESSTLMNLRMELPEGSIELRVASKSRQTQQLEPPPAEAPAAAASAPR